MKISVGEEGFNRTIDAERDLKVDVVLSIDNRMETRKSSPVDGSDQLRQHAPSSPTPRGHGQYNAGTQQ